ncbi:uncharacterized protein LOC135469173 [Liolophura sinensis]|uniref:uncharacterized protein LOC135469173 n=1 Tax=Liolophura sinensis TaxID=3198878 RepID=UPI0031585297
MSASPHQFVPSTPSLSLHPVWSSVNSPVALVPDIMDRYQTSTNNADFSTPTAIVPYTPRLQHSPTARLTPVIKENSALHRVRRKLKCNSTPSSPKVGDVAEQVVPSTPYTSQEKTSLGLQWLEGECNLKTSENDKERKEQSTYKRESLLKWRLSPRAKPLCDRPISLFSCDDIFS